jgi:GNAT superfamily N-acetyltransferase
MIVRLHNLAARPPVESDLRAVTELLIECERAEVGVTNASEEEIENSWQMSGFVLRSDAWVIVTRKGQIVGYADVRRSGEYQLTSLVRVHPDYLGRGIGTLLVWLTEERARHLMRAIPLKQRVTLTNMVCSMNQRAQHLFQREGYALAHCYWHLVIRGDEEMDLPFYQRQPHLVIDVQNVVEHRHTVARTGIFVMHQYDVFEKELRPAETLPIVQTIEVQCMIV